MAEESGRRFGSGDRARGNWLGPRPALSHAPALTDVSGGQVGIVTGKGTGELVFDYRLNERVALTDTPDYRHLERWVISVSLGDDHGGGADQVGDAHVLVVNLEAGRDLTELVDRASGQWVDRAPVPTTTLSGSGGALDRYGDDTAGHTVVLDRVWVEPRYRGHGFGPLIAAVVLARLSRGCGMAACYPAPFASERRPQDRDGEVAALGRIWGKVGFVPWRDGVWMLDLQATDLHATVARLRTP